MSKLTPLNLQQRSMHAGEVLARADGGARARSLYIHVPFCFHKCHYCDFYSFVDNQDRQAAFVETLGKELRAIAPWAEAIETVFVGGGTPTLLAVDLWKRLLDVLHDAYDLAASCEFTVECNPETATPELMRTLRTGGVNRISIGAQSFEPRHLKTLERWHDYRDAVALACGIERPTAG